jgi:hypothetical protein
MLWQLLAGVLVMMKELQAGDHTAPASETGLNTPQRGSLGRCRTCRNITALQFKKVILITILKDIDEATRPFMHLILNSDFNLQLKDRPIHKKY